LESSREKEEKINRKVGILEDGFRRDQERKEIC